MCENDKLIFNNDRVNYIFNAFNNIIINLFMLNI